jgi:hypothetical protein
VVVPTDLVEQAQNMMSSVSSNGDGWKVVSMDNRIVEFTEARRMTVP